jgi:hypothetical protein
LAVELVVPPKLLVASGLAPLIVVGDKISARAIVATFNIKNINKSRKDAPNQVGAKACRERNRRLLAIR